MNEEQFKLLLEQLTKIANTLDLMQDSDLGSLAGIEVSLSHFAEKFIDMNGGLEQ